MRCDHLDVVAEELHPDVRDTLLVLSAFITDYLEKNPYFKLTFLIEENV